VPLSRRYRQCHPPAQSLVMDSLLLTVNFADAEAALPPSVVCNAPAASVLMRTLLQLAGAVTVTLTVQEPLAGIEPPVNPTVEPPVLAVSVPPQVVLALPKTVMPLGK